LPACSPPFFLSSVCLLRVLTEISSWPLPISPVHFQCSIPLCCCGRLQFVVCYSLFCRRESVCPVAVLVYPRVGWGNFLWCMVLTYLFCLELTAVVVVGAPPCWLLGTIKGWFVGQSLNFFLHLVWWQLLFWLQEVRVTQVWLQLLREVLESHRLDFLLPYPSRHLGPSDLCNF
jgi:hypothetical protein